jgi:hypothetical protein
MPRASPRVVSSPPGPRSPVWERPMNAAPRDRVRLMTRKLAGPGDTMDATGWQPDGWDAHTRIGVLAPHADVGPESELQALAPQGVRIYGARVLFTAMGSGGVMDPTIPHAPVRAFAEPPSDRRARASARPPDADRQPSVALGRPPCRRERRRRARLRAPVRHPPRTTTGMTRGGHRGRPRRRPESESAPASASQR